MLQSYPRTLHSVSEPVFFCLEILVSPGQFCLCALRTPTLLNLFFEGLFGFHGLGNSWFCFDAFHYALNLDVST